MKFDENLDLEVNERGEYIEDKSLRTAILTALYTNQEVEGLGGYWIENIHSSQLWAYDQFSDSLETRRRIEIEIEKVLDSLQEELKIISYSIEMISLKNIIINVVYNKGDREEITL